MPTRLPQIPDNTWITPAKGYVIECCDCHLRHRLELGAFVRGKRMDERKAVLKFRVRRMK